MGGPRLHTRFVPGPLGMRLLVEFPASWLQFLVPGHRLLASRFRNSRFQTYDVTFTEACMIFDGFGHNLGAFMEQFSVRFSEYIEKRRKLDSIGKTNIKANSGFSTASIFKLNSD